MKNINIKNFIFNIQSTMLNFVNFLNSKNLDRGKSSKKKNITSLFKCTQYIIVEYIWEMNTYLYANIVRV